MLSFEQIIELGLAFLFSLAMLFFLRKIALNVGLVDRPNDRKHHSGAIPLVGGIAICLSILSFLFDNRTIFDHAKLYAISITILVIVGALDDKFDISYKFRFAIQGLLSLAMMLIAGIELHTVGDILGSGIIRLEALGYIVTVFAVIGSINAFNMVDGIDGLLGGLSIVTFSGLGLLMSYHGLNNLSYFCLFLIVITVPYILLNLGAFKQRRKVFMGDAGSMLIGFTVIWLLLISSQEETALMKPVTALWLIAIPLMDMCAIMIRRIRRGQSPFKPDREHLHHLCQKVGLSSTQSLVAICSVASLCGAIGILGEVANIPEYVMFYLFLIVFVLYLVFLTYLVPITDTIKRWIAR